MGWSVRDRQNRTLIREAFLRSLLVFCGWSVHAKFAKLAAAGMVGYRDLPRDFFATRFWQKLLYCADVVLIRFGHSLSVLPMAIEHSEGPSLAVRPCKDRSGWYVEAWWLKRPLEQIGHFHTHGDARKWIEFESISYFVLREIESMIRQRSGSGATPESALDAPPLSSRGPPSEAAA
jgi:hypothetical protein